MNCECEGSRLHAPHEYLMPDNPNPPPHPHLTVENLSFEKLVPVPKKVGDHCFDVFFGGGGRKHLERGGEGGMGGGRDSFIIAFSFLDDC